MASLLTEEAKVEATLAGEAESAAVKLIEDRERQTVLRGIVLSAMMADIQNMQAKTQVCSVH